MNTGNGHHHHHDHDVHHHHDEQENEALLNALSGASDPGSRVTLLGLAANILLTVIKAVAGYVLSSASLLADAGHGLSDLLGDFVTLTTWKIAKRPPTKSYPFGFGRFESLGAIIVAFFLLAGGFGVGAHSYSLLTSHQPSHGHGHGHGHHDDEEGGDFRASIFALLSIVVKESLYRVTLKVAKQEQSSVLMASALHHRSDAQSSLVALLAIGASSLGFPIFDPIGGLLVSIMILRGGFGIGWSAFKDLMDYSPASTLPLDIQNLTLTLVDETPLFKPPTATSPNSLVVVQMFKLGGQVAVEVQVSLQSTLSLLQVEEFRNKLHTQIQQHDTSIKHIWIRFIPK